MLQSCSSTIIGYLAGPANEQPRNKGREEAARGPTAGSSRQTTGAGRAAPNTGQGELNTSLVVYTGEEQDSTENHRYF